MSPPPPPPDEAKNPIQKTFEKWISTRKILVADGSATSRSAIVGALKQVGVQAHRVALASKYGAAAEEIAKHKPEVVICDYDLGKGRGLDLLQMQRAQNPDAKQCLFVLVTGNTSQSAVARAAEEDCDTYILKPFTAEVLRNSIMKAALLKISPPAYVKMIEDGKEKMIAGALDEAADLFARAVELDGAPSLAHFYSAQVEMMRKARENAEGDYALGLGFNKIHYKCLVGMFDLLMEDKRFKEAYDVIKRVSQYFPANPARLNSVLRLAIITQSYDDVERYYQIFTSIEERNEEMIKYICAALVICGKYYLKASYHTRALEVFQKAAVTGQGRTKILREIVTSLCDAGQPKQAQEFLKRFPADSLKGADHLCSQLLILDALGPALQVVNLGRQIIGDGVDDPQVYEVMIRRWMGLMKPDAAEDLFHKAVKLWPEQKTRFARARGAGTPAATQPPAKSG